MALYCRRRHKSIIYGWNESRLQAALFVLPQGLSCGKLGTKSRFAIAEIAATFATAVNVTKTGFSQQQLQHHLDDTKPIERAFA